jgi:hypothetical protein
MQEQSDQEEDDGVKPLRMPADIKIKKGMSWREEMGVAVGLLSEMNRDDLLTWVKDVSSHLCSLMWPSTDLSLGPDAFFCC